MLPKPNWLNYCLELKNEAYLDFDPGNDLILPRIAKTVEMLVYLDHTNGIQPIICRLSRQEFYYSIPFIYLRDGMVCIGTRERIDIGKNPNFVLEAQQWYHIAVTYSHGTAAIYIDGTKAFTTNYNNLFYAAQESFLVGAVLKNSSAEVKYSFSGKIGFLRLWSRVLSENEIAENMTNSEINGRTKLYANFDFSKQETYDFSEQKIPFSLINNACFKPLFATYAESHKPFSRPFWMRRCFHPKYNARSYFILSKSALNLEKDFTFEGWIYLTDSKYESQIFDLPVYDNNSIGRFQLSIKERKIQITNFSGGSKLKQVDLVFDQTLEINAWYHIACSYSWMTAYYMPYYSSSGYVDKKVKLFINGRQVGANYSAYTAMNRNDFNAKITNNLDGYLGGFRIWDEARNAEQIMESMFMDTITSPADQDKLKLEVSFNDDYVLNNSPFLIQGKGVVRPETTLESINRLYKEAPGGGFALQMTGDGGIKADPFQFGTSDFTLESWVKTAQEGTVFSGIRKNDNEGLHLGIESNGKIKFQVKSDDLKNIVYIISQKTDILKDQQWHHIAVMRKGQELLIYLDGILQRNTRVVSVPNNLKPDQYSLNKYTNFYIGRTPNRPSPRNPEQYYFVGTLDEIRVWNRALSAAEIRGGMAHILNGDEPGLLAHWSFDDQTAVDSSPNNHGARLLVGKTGFTADVINLSPAGYPYLMIQTKLMQDFQAFDHPDDFVNTYRVVITVYAGNDSPTPNEPITISADEMMTIYVDDTENGTKPFDIGLETDNQRKSHTLNTNGLGQVSFAIRVNDQYREGEQSALSRLFHCAHIKVSASFFETPDEWVIISPDKHIHHFLSSVDQNSLQEMAQNGNKSGKPINQLATRKALANGLNQIMCMATKHHVHREHPLVAVGNKGNLGFDINDFRPATRRHENVYMAYEEYIPLSNTTASHHVKHSETVKRIVNPLEMPYQNWIYEAQGIQHAFRPRLTNSEIDLTKGNTVRPLGKLAGFIHNNGNGPFSPDQIKNLLSNEDSSGKKRSAWGSNLWKKIKTKVQNAEKVIVQTEEVIIQYTANDVQKSVYLVSATIVEAGEAVVSKVIIETVEDAAALAEGLIKKVEAELEDVINYVKGKFDWEEIKLSKKVMEVYLTSLLSHIKTTYLPQKKTDINDSINKSKQQLRNLLQGPQFLSDQPEIKNKINHIKLGSSKTYSKQNQPQDIQATYFQRLTSSHAHSSDFPGIQSLGNSNSNSAINDSIIAQVQNQFSLDSLIDNLSRTTIVRAFNQSKTDAALFNLDVKTLLEEEIEGLLEELLDALQSGLDKAIDKVIENLGFVDQALKQEISIPIVTYLYNKFVCEKEHTSDCFNLYNLVSFVGGTMYTVINKAIFRENFSSFSDIAVRLPENSPVSWATFEDIYTQQNLKRQEISTIDKLSWALGYVFSASIIVSSVAGFRDLSKKPLNPITNFFFRLTEWITQLASFPALNIQSIAENSNNPEYSNSYQDYVNTLELMIWNLQFIPLILSFEQVQKRINESIYVPPTEPEKDFSSILVSGFGFIHALSFLGLGVFDILNVYEKETNENYSQKQKDEEMGDIIVKMIFNIVSTIPEVLAGWIKAAELAENIPEADTQIAARGAEKALKIISASALGAWGLGTGIRVLVDNKRSMRTECR